MIIAVFAPVTARIPLLPLAAQMIVLPFPSTNITKLIPALASYMVASFYSLHNDMAFRALSVVKIVLQVLYFVVPARAPMSLKKTLRTERPFAFLA